MTDAIQDEHVATFECIEEVHNFAAVWDVSYVVYKDTKNKQRFKRPSHSKLKFANSCWQTQVGVCERHKNCRQTLIIRI